MQFCEFFIIFFVLQKGIECYFFDSENDTEHLNQGCEKSAEKSHEGNLGQKHLFPWLGILRVHIHDHKTFRIALTGVVLVTDKHAIANAADISKIPMNTMRSDSQVMFIMDDNMPSFCTVVDYMLHPEFEITTNNTVAILELYNNGFKVRSRPICWPYQNFNTSNQLFLMGYTDERKVLEKTMYQLQYVDKTLCHEFYKRSNLSSADMSNPVNYQCGFAINSKENCIWENGRVVASNASGYWTLIGLLITGPGCAAPARFLDITAYMPWLITAMNMDENYEVSVDVTMRRSLGNGYGRDGNSRRKGPRKDGV